MDYDEEKNFKVFLKNKSIYDKVIEILKRHNSRFRHRAIELEYSGCRDQIFHEFAFIYKYGYRTFLNQMCVWASQPEGETFWARLHEEWGIICANKTNLKRTIKQYKSIW